MAENDAFGAEFYDAITSNEAGAYEVLARLMTQAAAHVGDSVITQIRGTYNANPLYRSFSSAVDSKIYQTAASRGLAGLSVLNDFVSGDNWVSEIGKQAFIEWSVGLATQYVSSYGAGLLAPSLLTGGAIIAGLAMGIVAGHAWDLLEKAIEDGVPGEIADLIADVLGSFVDEISNLINDAIDKVLADISDLLDGLSSGGLLDLFESIEEIFAQASVEVSPLIIDLNGDGEIELVNLNSDTSVYWDIDVDGKREKTSWVGPNDGLLALDSNDNGFIDNHSELFGNKFIDGFTLLSSLDSNFDGKINQSDDHYSELVVWQDANSDGYTNSGEITSLDASGISEIDLNYTEVERLVEGNKITHESTATKNGISVEIVDVWFNYNNLDSTELVQGDFNTLYSYLPHLRAYGDLNDIHIVYDDNKNLVNLVEDLIENKTLGIFKNKGDLNNLVEQIMFEWAGVNSIHPEARTNFIDSRKIAYLEEVLGYTFIQNNRETPGPQASKLLESAFDQARDSLTTRLLYYSKGFDLFNDAISFDWQSDKFELQNTTSGIPYDIVKLKNISQSFSEYETKIEFWTIIITSLNSEFGIEDNVNNFNELTTALLDETGYSFEGFIGEIYPKRFNDLNGSNASEVLTGFAARDYIVGLSGNDTIKGLGGDDEIRGGNGDDELTGGFGDDVILGGSGNDTYIYQSGYETYKDTSGANDRIILPDDTLLVNIKAMPAIFDLADATLNVTDLDIFLDDTKIITIQDYYTNDGGIESITINNEILSLENLVLTSVSGTEFDDDFQSTRTTTYYEGLGGNDTIRGWKGLDVLVGGAGNDEIHGNGGNDKLVGGLGNDLLDGGVGNDIYITGGGSDTITVEGNDTAFVDSNDVTLLFYSTPEIYKFTAYKNVISNDLRISDSTNDITLINYYGNSESGEYTIKLISGEILESSQIVEAWEGSQYADRITGTADDNIIHALGGNDYIYGKDGNDLLFSGNGDDVIYGGDGEDTIYGTVGNNTLIGGDGSDSYYVSNGNSIIKDNSSFGDEGIDSLYINAERENLSISRIDDSGLTISWGEGSVILPRIANNNIENIYVHENNKYNLLDLSNHVINYYGSDDNRNIEMIYGDFDDFGSTNDIIYGQGGNDFIYGLTGDDTLIAGTGNDTLNGGIGSDTYIIQYGDNIIREFNYDDEEVLSTDTVDIDTNFSSSYDLFVTGNLSKNLNVKWDTGSLEYSRYLDETDGLELLYINDVLIDLSKNYPIHGNEGNNQISGNQSNKVNHNDIIYGYEGDDTLYGLDGEDTLVGGAGNDRLVGSINTVDYAVINASLAEISLANESNNVSHSFTIVSPDGTDKLRYIDYLKLTDITISTSDFIARNDVSVGQLDNNAENIPAMGYLDIEGSYQEGETLIINITNIFDENGFSPDAFIYTWYADGVLIENQNTDHLLLSQSHVGKIITAKINFLDNSGYEEFIKYDNNDNLVKNINNNPNQTLSLYSNTNTYRATVDGNTKLKFNPNDIIDLDGVDKETFSYKWYRNDTLVDQTNNEYTLTNSDHYKRIKLVLSYIDNFGTHEVVNSYFSPIILPSDAIAKTLGGDDSTTEFVVRNEVLSNAITANTRDEGAAIAALGSKEEQIAALKTKLDQLLALQAQSQNSISEDEVKSRDHFAQRLGDMLNSDTGSAKTLNMQAIDISSVTTSETLVFTASQTDDEITSIVLDLGSTKQELIVDGVEFLSVKGDAVIRGGEGQNTFLGDAGSQDVVMGEDDDVLSAGAGNDRVGSEGGDDTISGGSGNDIAFGGVGNDDVSGDSGSDTISDSWGDDVLSGGDGDDHIMSFTGSDTIDGGAGSDTIMGGRGDDLIDGGEGNDVIMGDTRLQSSRGDDTIDGGAGDDLMHGGYGADTFVFSAEDRGNNTIARITNGAASGADFEVGTDVVKLLGFGLDATTVLSDDYWSETDGDAVFAKDGVTVTFDGIALDELTVDSFEFV